MVRILNSPWVEVEAYEDKLAMIELLNPSGPLLKHLILSRFDQDIRYEFPVELLPVRLLIRFFAFFESFCTIFC